MNTQPLLKTKFNCFYNYQKILNENPTIISNWFVLLCNIITKYGIQPKNLYNFDKINFMINLIIFSIIITHSDKHGKIKLIQFNN